MKRILALMVGLVLFAGCGAAEMGELETTVKEATTAAPAPTNTLGGERFPLFAELPEDDLQVYGILGENYQQGMVLFHEGRETYFSGWGFTFFGCYPELAYRDFDGDGKKDIGAITLRNHGSGTHATDLHIITVEETKWPNSIDIDDDTIYYSTYEYIDHVFTIEEVRAWFDKNLASKWGKQAGSLEVTIGGKSFSLALDPEQSWQGNVRTRDIVSFGFEGGNIQLNVGVGVPIEDMPSGVYIGFFTANVTFDGKEFHIEIIDFEPEE